ncbi:tyrosine recombinase XerD [Clostridium saccharobutylicum]|uniref:tyrosine-type recombinase/integrase n=1 Tax=Clostridium saccharobutylicum TaxID=169679 RepID=UPI000983B48C|nr:tyrosine-type recombinase/integrase [Clostridium saccharobutylicum]AQS09910.1 tyrosine recombinase XerD [Clostridium saccharobutylicum]AQS11163.1 tyrosine recombinase XerD [Clostridium saccharobutylicum]MBC2438836.1 site-specific integrase [Clostridium saccharobutylicum]NSB91114.1 integrase [Clostridium saccharobutylicum]NYC27681.1 integrase [Clostridium saccharobutylicum]
MASKIPNGDNWELIDNDSNSQYYGKKFKFHFSYIESNSVKNVIKSYVWRNYKEGNITLNGLKQSLSVFININTWLINNNIVALSSINNNDIENLISFLKTLISTRTKKPLAYQSQKKHIDFFKAIIRWGQLYIPNEVPKTEIFTGNEYIGVNRKLKIDFIPDEVLQQINRALLNEKNPYVKYGIIILQSTGMRIGDMLKLTTNSVKPHLISGYTLTWYDHKNRKKRQPMPIPNECAIAVEKLIEHTKELREQADDNIKDYLFIYKIQQRKNKDKIQNIYVQQITHWFNAFVQNNEIRDNNGELYNLKAHQFRRTLATDMLSKGTDLKAIQEVLGHSSAMTTKRHYADVKDKERAEVIDNVGIIGNINKVDETVITDKNDLIWFKENKDNNARMEDGYCTKPCSDGKICDRLLKRQKCYTCSRYITTPEYLQAHKNHLAELEKQLEGNIYGDHYAEHFLHTIEILKEIVKRLEEIQDGNNQVKFATNNY